MGVAGSASSHGCTLHSKYVMLVCLLTTWTVSTATQPPSSPTACQSRTSSESGKSAIPYSLVAELAHSQSTSHTHPGTCRTQISSVVNLAALRFSPCSFLLPHLLSLPFLALDLSFSLSFNLLPGGHLQYSSSEEALPPSQLASLSRVSPSRP